MIMGSLGPSKSRQDTRSVRSEVKRTAEYCFDFQSASVPEEATTRPSRMHRSMLQAVARYASKSRTVQLLVALTGRMKYG